MADRKMFYSSIPNHPELDKLIEQAKAAPATEAELREQRISFAYGCAPKSSSITKATVRQAAEHMRMTFAKGAHE